MCPERRFAQVLDAPIYTELKRALDSRHLGVGPPTGVTHSADVDASVLLHHSRVVPFSLQCINNVLWLENGFAKMETLESPLKVQYTVYSLRLGACAVTMVAGLLSYSRWPCRRWSTRRAR